MIVGIGTDITRLDRFETNTEALAKKILTKKEYELYAGYKSSERKIEFLAGRFAAKEAIIKALDVDKILSDIEVLNAKNGAPICNIPGYKIHISISHEKDYAIAYAICEK